MEKMVVVKINMEKEQRKLNFQAYEAVNNGEYAGINFLYEKLTG